MIDAVMICFAFIIRMVWATLACTISVIYLFSYFAFSFIFLDITWPLADGQTNGTRALVFIPLTILALVISIVRSKNFLPNYIAALEDFQEWVNEVLTEKRIKKSTSEMKANLASEGDMKLIPMKDWETIANFIRRSEHVELVAVADNDAVKEHKALRMKAAACVS